MIVRIPHLLISSDHGRQINYTQGHRVFTFRASPLISAAPPMSNLYRRQHGSIEMEKPTPSQTRLRDKLAHLTPQQRSRVLKMLRQMAPKHNAEIIKARITAAASGPLDEQAMLPIVIELFESAMDLGYVRFKPAARYVREFLAGTLDQEQADAVRIDTLQGVYIATARRYKDKGSTSKAEVVAIESFDELNEPLEPTATSADYATATTGQKNAPNTNASVERDRPDAGTEPTVVDLVPNEPRGSDHGTGSHGHDVGKTGGRRTSDPVLPSDSAAVGGKRGDQHIHGGS
jgi:hypothetical protein